MLHAKPTPERRRWTAKLPAAYIHARHDHEADPLTAAVLVAVELPRRDDPAPLALGLRLTRIADAPLLLAAACPESEQAETEAGAYALAGG